LRITRGAASRTFVVDAREMSPEVLLAACGFDVLAHVGFLIRFILEGTEGINVTPAWAEGARTNLMARRQAERRASEIVSIYIVVTAAAPSPCCHLATRIALTTEAKGTTTGSGRGGRNGGGRVDVIC
jgi:hypothetical protein